jgi:hypothetical protein
MQRRGRDERVVDASSRNPSRSRLLDEAQMRPRWQRERSSGKPLGQESGYDISGRSMRRR